MIWVFTTLLMLTVAILLYTILGIILILRLYRWLWLAYKERQIKKEMKEFREWDVTLMDGLENEEWDNKHHNENI